MSFEHLDDQYPFVPDDTFRAAALREGRRRRRRRFSLAAGSAAAAVLVVALLVVTVPGTDPDRVDTRPAPTTETTATSVATTSTTRPETTTTETSTTTTAPVLDLGTDIDAYSFWTPSGNIACVINDFGAACDALQYSYDPGPFPDNCPLDWGYRIGMTVERGPEFECAGDSLHGAPHEVLEYGAGVRSGGFECRSAVEGVTCTADDGRGFFLSRQAYRFF